MEPSITSLPALNLLGLCERFILPSRPGASNLDVIPKLYAQFCPQLHRLQPQLDKFLYGATRLPAGESLSSGVREYLASIRVAPERQPQAPLVMWQIPAATYACFTHRGPVARLGATVNYALNAWLPRSPYTLGDSPTLERQDERFGDGGPDCVLDFLVPIMPRVKNA